MKSGFLCRLSAGWRSHGHFLLPQLAALMLVATIPLSPVRANMPGTFQPVLLAQTGGVSPLNCTGGTITASGSNRVHTFTSSGSLVCTGVGTINYVVVAGGGSGGGIDGGGGGAGGFQSAMTSLLPGTYPITVGNGGASVSNTSSGNSGQNSSLALLVTAIGGGGGGSQGGTASGVAGGSGGGGTFSNGTGGAGTVGQGSNGGAGNSSNGAGAGGGGGSTAGSSVKVSRPRRS